MRPSRFAHTPCGRGRGREQGWALVLEFVVWVERDVEGGWRFVSLWAVMAMSVSDIITSDRRDCWEGCM
eukprot:1305318-Amorphochlora_amoeboformis.AAC.1